ncbi:MAG: tRNA lysidine(34) synthetase TilS [Clostridia bacterium]|nr:tRNA lysidine(34) synthetase TilS [Clostridia bacterium]
MVLNIIRQTISEYRLLNKGDKVLIGLSGGADSVCLTYALCALKEELGIEIAAAHLNHGIRGEEALRDEVFAQRFSATLGIKCHIRTADIPHIAQQNEISEETAGRNARYEFFDELCKEFGYTKIATAHNKNDNAETILMNFMRGSGITGLCGIPFSRDNIIRPIINVSRYDIEKYCNENNLEYVTDSTNLTDEYTRNKVRNVLIPLIQKEFNSNFINTITDNSMLIKADCEYIEKQALETYRKIVKNSSVEISELLSSDISISRRVIRLMLKNIYGSLDGISAGYINDVLSILSKQSGTSINLVDNVIARIEYGKLIIERISGNNTVTFEYEFSCDDERYISEIGKNVVISKVDTRNKDSAVYIGTDYDKKIIIRNRRSGDKFYPFGMNGSKKVKEYFIDKKIPKDKRGLVPIIEIDGNIAAVGDRVDKRFMFKNSGIRIEFKEI